MSSAFVLPFGTACYRDEKHSFSDEFESVIEPDFMRGMKGLRLSAEHVKMRRARSGILER